MGEGYITVPYTVELKRRLVGGCYIVVNDNQFIIIVVDDLTE